MSDEHTHLRRCGESNETLSFLSVRLLILETSCLHEIGHVLGSCGCVAVASFFGVPLLLISTLDSVIGFMFRLFYTQGNKYRSH
jgi:ABC-type multidrug transport system permease subunit